MEENVNTLLYRQFQEQKELDITWSPIISCSSVAMSELSLAQATSEHCQDTFITILGQWSYHKSVKYVILRGSETREFGKSNTLTSLREKCLVIWMNDIFDKVIMHTWKRVW